MLDLILKGGANYWVVGDDDQAIYGWRGSDVDFILNFDTYYPGSQKVQLLKNYRSGSTIINFSSYLALQRITEICKFRQYFIFRI